MLSVALADWVASFLTSSATTAKPFPCSPALAASIAAFRASKLVCPAILFIKSTICSISLLNVPSSEIVTDILLVTSLMLLIL